MTLPDLPAGFTWFDIMVGAVVAVTVLVLGVLANWLARGRTEEHCSPVDSEGVNHDRDSA